MEPFAANEGKNICFQEGLEKVNHSLFPENLPLEKLTK